MKTCAIIALAALAVSGTSVLAQDHYTATPLTQGQNPVIVVSPLDNGYDATWNTIDGGGRVQRSGTLTLEGTVGQFDPGILISGNLELATGFWGGVSELAPCYVDCDGSSASPRLTSDDFTCFMNRYLAGDPYANCDGSVAAPVLNVLDFQCFINKFAAGCS